jgi:hypothetical protein
MYIAYAQREKKTIMGGLNQYPQRVEIKRIKWAE